MRTKVLEIDGVELALRAISLIKKDKTTFTTIDALTNAGGRMVDEALEKTFDECPEGSPHRECFHESIPTLLQSITFIIEEDDFGYNIILLNRKKELLFSIATKKELERFPEKGGGYRLIQLSAEEGG